MSRNRVSRRKAMGVLSSGLALSPLIVKGALHGAQDAAANAPANAEELFRPLKAGQSFCGFEIESFVPPRNGAAGLHLKSEDGHRFELEVLARDTQNILAPKPPGETKFFAVFVKNGGDGWLPTAEAQGLCAMALSELIAINEREPLLKGFLTHTERLERHRAELFSHITSAL